MELSSVLQWILFSTSDFTDSRVFCCSWRRIWRSDLRSVRISMKYFISVFCRNVYFESFEYAYFDSTAKSYSNVWIHSIHTSTSLIFSIFDRESFHNVLNLSSFFKRRTIRTSVLNQQIIYLHIRKASAEKNNITSPTAGFHDSNH